MFRLNRTWLTIAFALTSLLLAVHLYALSAHLYWYLPWFDVPMHILGGAALGSLLLAFGTARKTTVYLLCMLVVVVGWEVFEYLGHISTGQAHYWADTLLDMANGIIGSLVVLIISRKSSWH